MSELIPDEPEVIAQRLEDYIYVFYGMPGIGKTTWVYQLFGTERLLFISTDRGTRDYPVRRVECNTWSKIDRVFEKLEKKNPNVDFICFDFIDDIANLIEQHILKYYSKMSKSGTEYETIAEIPHGKGWAMLKGLLRSLVQRTLKLGVCPIFIAHEHIKEVTANGMTIFKTMPAMSKQSSDAILPIANLVGQITTKRVKLEGGKRENVRVLVTKPRDELYVKDRTCRRKPDSGYELLDVEAFRATFEPATKKGRRARS